MSIAVNEFQTELTDELLASLKPEIKDQLLDILTSIPFVQSLVSPNRKRAKDLPRDAKGRIIVDLANPHILENMDYFREAAIYFKKYGVYTHLRPNSNPNSEFMKFMKREIHRCWYGMVRESDGEWIPGYLYFYLNYSIIKQTKVRVGTKQGDRVEDFPECWEGNYFMFHYIEQARNGGMYNDFLGGQHCVEIAKRAAGKSFSVAAMCNRNMLLGENEITNKGIVSVVTAQEKESLIKDGTLNKFVSNLDHCSNHTQFPRQRLRDSLNDMEWIMGYKDADTGVSRGSKNTVQGVSTNNDSDKARGKRANLYIYEEFGRFKQFINTWQVNFQAVQEGDIAFGQALAIGTGGTVGSDFSGALEIIYNPLGYNVYALPNVFDRNSQGKQRTVFFFGAYLNRKGCYNQDGVSDVVAALLQLLEHRYKTKYNSNDATMLSRVKAENPITIQEAIMKRDSTIYPVGELVDRISELDSNPNSLDDVYVGKLQIKGNLVDYMPDMDAKSIREFPHKDNKIMGAVEIFMMPERDNTGYVTQGRYIAGCLLPGEKVLTDRGLRNVEDVTSADKLINKDGELVDINTLLRYRKVNEPVYSMKMYNTYRTTTFTQEHPIYISKTCTDFDFKTVDKVEEGNWIKYPNVYRKETQDYLELSEDKALLQSKEFWWFVGMWVGSNNFISNDIVKITLKNKDIASIQKLENFIKHFLRVEYEKNIGFTKTSLVFEDKEIARLLNKYFSIGTVEKVIPECVKHLPLELKKRLILGYFDYFETINNSTVNDIIIFNSKNLIFLESIQDILFSLNLISSLDVIPPTLTSKSRGYRLTLASDISIILMELLSSLDNSKVIKKVFNSDNEESSNCIIDGDYIYFRVKSIVKDTYTGVVYNFDCETHTFLCHHITTHNCDPYDDDVSDTLSLGSIFILDLFTDQIVAEFTGRPMFADEFYETCRRLLIMYSAECNYENNKKGLYKYFSQHNCLYLLSDTLTYLKDKETNPKVSYGNKIKGTVASAPIKSYARTIIRNWLLKPYISKGFTDNGDEYENSVYNLNTIRSRALLKELSLWNQDGNFDRHDALGMLMLLREDKLRLFGTDTPQDRLSLSGGSGLEQDDFFTKNYDNRY